MTELVRVFQSINVSLSFYPYLPTFLPNLSVFTQREGEDTEGDEREGEINFKVLGHMIVASGDSKILMTSQKAGKLGLLCCRLETKFFLL